MERPLQHAQASFLRRDGRTRKAAWIRRLLALDLKPEVVILEEYQSGEGLGDLECAAIAHYRSMGFDLTNGTDGGDGCPGRRHTPDSIEKMRRRVFTPEHRAKLSAAKKGKPKSEAHKEKLRLVALAMPDEQRRKIGDAGRGREVSPETRAKMCAAQRGRKWTEDQKLAARGRKLSPEHREKLRLAALSRTPEHLAKIGAGVRLAIAEGRRRASYPRPPFTEECLQNMRRAALAMSPEARRKIYEARWGGHAGSTIRQGDAHTGRQE